MTYWQQIRDWFNSKGNTAQGFILIGLAILILAFLALVDAVL